MSEEIDWKSRAEAAELLNEEYRIQLLMADKISGEQRSRAEAAEAENDRLQARVDYLKRNGLTGSILRSDEPQPAEIPDSGGHLESADCWCGPTVEEHPGGTLIIHIRTH